MSSRDPKEEAARLNTGHSWLDGVARKEAEAQKELQRKLTEYKVTGPNGFTIETDPSAADPEAEHKRVMQVAMAMAGVPAPTQAPIAVEPPKAKAALTLLSVAIIKYLATKSKGSTNKQEETERKFNLKQFRLWHEESLIELYVHAQKAGTDWPVIEVNKSVFTPYKDFLFDEEYAEKSIEKKGNHIKAFFIWCADNLPDWPDNKAIPVANQFTLSSAQKAAIKRLSGYQPFTTEEVQKIFEPANFKNYLAEKTPDWVKKPHNFFMPLLGLYTGARLNELAKAEIKDFENFDGIHGIHIRGTKNDTSEAWLPVHPDLIKTGLLEYVNFIKAQGHSLLFPYLNFGRKGYGKTASDAFQKYLKQLGIKQKSQKDPKKGFHSFRDTVNTTIQNCKTWHCDEELRFGYLRHKHQSINLQHYGAAWAVHKLNSQAIPALSYPIAVPHFKDYLGSFEDIGKQISKLTATNTRLKKSKAHMKKSK